MKMERYVLLMEMQQQEELKFVSMAYGGQCVIIIGISEMLELPAENLDYLLNVSFLMC